MPTVCLRTIDTVAPALARKLPRGISVHGLLAADVALDLGAGAGPRSASRYAPWDAVCPAPEAFATMPLLWPVALQALLPGAARELLAAQQAKLARDWADASVAFLGEDGDADDADDADEDDEDDVDRSSSSPPPPPPPQSRAERRAAEAENRYRHGWLLVNTRTFYYYLAPGTGTSTSTDTGGDGVDGGRRGRGRGGRRSSRSGPKPSKRRKIRPDDPDSCMCLQPVADLFNHVDDGAERCGVAFDGDGYAVRAERAHAAGEEVRISYGRHPGDFLLVEYGFTMGDGDDDAEEGEDDGKEDGKGEGLNRWDEVALDDVVLPRLSARQRETLDAAGFLGRYVLDRRTVCHRTEVAVHLLCCGDRVGEWRRFVDGADDGSAGQAEVDALLVEMLREYREKAERTIREVEGSEAGQPEQRVVLARRWRQIRGLLSVNIERLRKSSKE